MKSHETGEDAVYLRVFIPDKYEADLSGCALSCEQRHDFSGLEYFSTLDGEPVAAARFLDGQFIDKVFLGDTSISREERLQKFNALIGDMIICRCNRGTRSKDEMDYGKPGTVFQDANTGLLYICVDVDGDGKTDAVTAEVWMTLVNTGGGGGNSGGGTAGGFDGGFGGGFGGGNNSGGTAGNSDGGFGSGIGGIGGGSGASGGSTGGNGNSGSDSGNSDNNGSNSNGSGGSNNDYSNRFNNVESKIDPFGGFTNDNPPTLKDDRKPDINLGDKNKFAGYGANGKNDCLTLCKVICDNYNISNYGSSAHVFKLTHEVNGVLTHYGNNVVQNYKNAIACIDRHLEAGRPIIVGVNYKIGKGINEKTTDHFVVIYGRGYDSSTGYYYYNYYEVGRGNITFGYNDSSNRFIYEPSEPPYFYDPESNRIGRERYDVVQVRPNDGDTSGTIPQDSK